MYLVIKRKQSVNVDDVILDRELIMSKFSKEYIGNVLRLERSVDDKCLKDYGYSNFGLRKGNLFMPALCFNIIKIYFTDTKIAPITMEMKADEEYTLYDTNGSIIEELHPYGYVSTEVPCEEEE